LDGERIYYYCVLGLSGTTWQGGKTWKPVISYRGSSIRFLRKPKPSAKSPGKENRGFSVDSGLGESFFGWQAAIIMSGSYFII